MRALPGLRDAPVPDQRTGSRLRGSVLAIWACKTLTDNFMAVHETTVIDGRVVGFG